MKKFLALLSLVLFSVTVNAQVLLSGGLSYSQNFDTLANSGSSSTWTDNTTLTGWYASRAYTAGTTSAYGPFAYTSYRIDPGTTTSGTLFSYGVAGVNPVTDRALGSLDSGTPKTNAFGVLIQNDTTQAVDSVTISYTGEQWRNGGVTAAQALAFSYKVVSSLSPPLDVVPAGVNGWIAFSSLNFVSPTTGVTAGALDGNNSANRIVFSSVLIPGVTLNPGDEIFLRWVDIDDTGNDHALAVDDFSATFSPVGVPEPSTMALAALGGLGFAMLRRRR